MLLLLLLTLQVHGKLQCGVPAPITSPLIVNGQDTSPGQWPWHTAVYYWEKQSTHYKCGGTLINEWFVVTAAHCVTDGSGNILATDVILIRLGIHDLKKLPKLVKQHDVTSIHKSPSYNSDTLMNDIALLKLRSKAEYDNFVRPACLYGSDDLTEKYGTAIGFGFTEKDVLSDVLKSASMPVVDHQTCLESDRDFFGPLLTRGMVCAGYTVQNATVCNGDSGGGFFMKKGNKWYLAGIISVTRLREGPAEVYCQLKGYAIFTKVSNYLSWIHGVISSNQSEDTFQSRSNSTMQQAVPNSSTQLNSAALNRVSNSNSSTPIFRIFKNAEFQCGVPKNPNTLLIVNGVDAKTSDWPWHVGIWSGIKYQNTYICGGTLISEEFVITAGFCVADEERKRINNMRVQLGANINKASEGKFIKVHKMHIIESDQIAILELKDVVEFSDFVLPICISRKINVETGSLGTVVGWGLMENDTNPTTLQLARLPVVDIFECIRHELQAYGSKLNDNYFCAGYTNGTSVCNGDGGGGIFFERDNAWYLGGIISFTREREDNPWLCATTTYNVFIKLSSFMSWIENITNIDFSGEYGIEKPIECSTPEQTIGHCVPVQQCKNIFHNLTLPTHAESINHIRSKICKLRGFSKSVCCDPNQVERIPIHPNASLMPLNCGVAKRTSPTTTAHRAGVYEFPWTAMVRSRNATATGNELFCAATLINNRYVLGSAGCLSTYQKHLDSVRLGDRTVSSSQDCDTVADPKTGQFRLDCTEPLDVEIVRPFILHPISRENTQTHDVGLVRLAEKLQFTENIQPICLPIWEHLRSNLPRTFIYAHYENFENRWQELFKTSAVFEEADECQSQYEEIGLLPMLTEVNFCAASQGPQYLCTQQVGSPLLAMVQENGAQRAVLYGIATAGHSDCSVAQNIAKVYIRVAAYVDWILESIKK